MSEVDSMRKKYNKWCSSKEGMRKKDKVEKAAQQALNNNEDYQKQVAFLRDTHKQANALQVFRAYMVKLEEESSSPQELFSALMREVKSIVPALSAEENLRVLEGCLVGVEGRFGASLKKAVRKGIDDIKPYIYAMEKMVLEEYKERLDRAGHEV